MIIHPVYYNLPLVFIVIAIISIGYDNIVLKRLMKSVLGQGELSHCVTSVLKPAGRCTVGSEQTEICRRHAVDKMVA